MFNDFIAKLTETLDALGVENIEKYAADYTARYNALKASNKSEFESVVALGDPIANAYAIAGVEYTAEEQLKCSLGLEPEEKRPATSDGGAEAEASTDSEHIRYSTGEKVFYWFFVVASLALEVAFYFIAAITGIVSVSYLIIAFGHFSGEQAWAVFGLAVLGLITFLIFAITATVLLKKIYLFAKKLIKS